MAYSYTYCPPPPDNFQTAVLQCEPLCKLALSVVDRHTSHEILVESTLEVLILLSQNGQSHDSHMVCATSSYVVLCAFGSHDVFHCVQRNWCPCSMNMKCWVWLWPSWENIWCPLVSGCVWGGGVCRIIDNFEWSEVMFGSYRDFPWQWWWLTSRQKELYLWTSGEHVGFDTGVESWDAEGRRLTVLDLRNSQEWLKRSLNGVKLKSSFLVCRPLDVFTRLNAHRPSFLMWRLIRCRFTLIFWFTERGFIAFNVPLVNT